MMTLRVCAFADEIEPAGRLAAALGAPLSRIPVHHFPDGETLPTVQAPAAELSVIYRSLDRPNAKLVDLLLAADALRRAGASRLILVAPYFCYLRQDALFAAGQPLSRDVVVPLIGSAFDGVVTVQAHLHRTHDLAAVLGVPTRNLWPIGPLADALPAYSSPPLVLAPDQEAGPWVEVWARRLGGEAISLHKTRHGDRAVDTLETCLDAAGRAVVIVDDIASSGATLASALRRLGEAGAASIDIAVAHALMSPEVLQDLVQAGARRIVSTDSVSHPTNAAHLAPILAEAVLQMRLGL